MKNRLSMKSSLFCLIIVFGFFLSIDSAQARYGYPRSKDDYINDFAGVINQSDKKAIRKRFKDLEHQTGIEAVAVTINSYKDYKTKDSSVEEFATGLFNKWGIGHKKENNGVLLLLAIKDRTCRIELGRGYGHMYDSKMKQIIQNLIIPELKKKKYSRALFVGARGIVQKITVKVSWFEYHKWHLLMGLLIVICILAGISCMKSGKTGWGWIFFTAAGVILLFLIRALMSGKSSSGFGGGDSFGGGASGTW